MKKKKVGDTQRLTESHHIYTLFILMILPKCRPGFLDISDSAIGWNSMAKDYFVYRCSTLLLFHSEYLEWSRERSRHWNDHITIFSFVDLGGCCRFIGNLSHRLLQIRALSGCVNIHLDMMKRQANRIVLKGECDTVMSLTYIQVFKCFSK